MSSISAVELKTPAEAMGQIERKIKMMHVKEWDLNEVFCVYFP